MCLLLASNNQLFLEWMQDIILCIPMTSKENPGGKIVITTVALRSLATEPSPIFLYYAEPISGTIVDLSSTLADKTHWVTKMSIDLGHITEITETKRVRLPRRPGKVRDTDDFRPLEFNGEPELWPLQDDNARKLIANCGLGPMPFTLITLPAQIYSSVIMRFGFTMSNDSAPKNIRETFFRFRGPEQIVNQISQETEEYRERLMVYTNGQEERQARQDLFDTITQRSMYLGFLCNNGLYHLLLAIQPPHLPVFHTRKNITKVESTPLIPSFWIQKDKDHQNPDDFLLRESDDSELFFYHFETLEKSFDIGCVARIMSG